MASGEFVTNDEYVEARDREPDPVYYNHPLLFPLAFWDGPPRHAISCLQLGSSEHRDVRYMTRVRLRTRRQLSGGDSDVLRSPHSSPSLVDSAKSPHPSPLRSAPPPPQQQSSLPTTDGRFLITGGVDGGLVVWSPQPQSKELPASKCGDSSIGYLNFSCHFVPSALLCRDTPSETTALAQCFLNGRAAVLELCSDGFLTMWDARGGRCFSSVRILPDDFVAESVHVYVACGVQYAVITGCSPTILLVKLATSEVLATLEHREPVVESVVISAQMKSATDNRARRVENLIAVTTSGMISTYVLHTYRHRQRRVGHEEARPDPHLRREVHITTILGTPHIPSDIVSMAVSRNEDNPKLLLVMEHHWLVCSLTDYQMDFPVISSREHDHRTINTPLTPTPSDSLASWAGGQYVGDRHVVLWTMRGDIYIYELDLGVSNGNAGGSDTHDEFTTPRTQRCSPETYTYTTQPPRFIRLLPAKPVCDIADHFVSLVKVDGNTLYRTWTNGCVERFIMQVQPHERDYNVSISQMSSRNRRSGVIGDEDDGDSSSSTSGVSDDEHQQQQQQMETANEFSGDVMISRCRHEPDLQLEMYRVPLLNVTDGFPTRLTTNVLPPMVVGHTSSDTHQQQNQATSDEHRLFPSPSPLDSEQRRDYEMIHRGFASDSEWNRDNPCTASALLKYQGASESIVLARGYQDGTIVVNSLLSNRLRVKVHSSSSAITTLLALPIDSSPIEAPVLISGNTGGQIHVYVMVTGQLLGTLHTCSRVISLHRPHICDEDDLSKHREPTPPMGVVEEEVLQEDIQVALSSYLDDNVAVLAPEPLHPFLVRSSGPASSVPTEDKPVVTTDESDIQVRMRSLSTYYAHTLSYGNVNADRDVLFAVDGDYMVTVYSLSDMKRLQVFPGHDSPVVAVYRNGWCRLADYVVVHTMHGSVYVWVLHTGNLERRLTGTYARAFLAARHLSSFQMDQLRFLPESLYPENDERVGLSDKVSLI